MYALSTVCIDETPVAAIVTPVLNAFAVAFAAAPNGGNTLPVTAPMQFKISAKCNMLSAVSDGEGA